MAGDVDDQGQTKANIMCASLDCALPEAPAGIPGASFRLIYNSVNDCCPSYKRFAFYPGNEELEACQVNNDTFAAVGEKIWSDENPCQTCICHADGGVKCRTID